MQIMRNKVLKASIRVLDDTLVHDDAPVQNVDSAVAVNELLHAFPDETKQTDGRGWLPLHWAMAIGLNTAGLSEEDVKLLYVMDPMAFQRYHQKGTSDQIVDMGYTPAHLLCMTDDCSNMSLIKHFSINNQRAFTMTARKPDIGDTLRYGFTALHAACFYGQPTEVLLKHLLQLDITQTKKMDSGEDGYTPLGYLCKNSYFSARLIDCLLQVDNSLEVVADGIIGCFVSTDCSFMLEKVEMLLKANPEAAKYRTTTGFNLLHSAANDGQLPPTLCIDVMQRILAIHKDAVRELDEDGWLPVQSAAYCSTTEVLDYLLGLYPESISINNYYHEVI